MENQDTNDQPHRRAVAQRVSTSKSSRRSGCRRATHAEQGQQERRRRLEAAEASDLPRRGRTRGGFAHWRSGRPERRDGMISAMSAPSGRCRASARGSGLSTTRPRKARKIEETYKFFHDVFRDDKSFQSFPTNTIFAPDWAGNAEAMMDFLFEPENYRNAFLPRHIMQSLSATCVLSGRSQELGEIQRRRFQSLDAQSRPGGEPGGAFLDGHDVQVGDRRPGQA